MIPTLPTTEALAELHAQALTDLAAALGEEETVDALAPRYAPGGFGCHEALHATAMAARLIREELCFHPAVAYRPEWFARAASASALLDALHERIEALHMPAVHGESAAAIPADRLDLAADCAAAAKAEPERKQLLREIEQEAKAEQTSPQMLREVFAPGSLGGYEALHAASVAVNLVDAEIVGHPAIIFSPTWHGRAVAALQQLEALLEAMRDAHEASEPETF